MQGDSDAARSLGTLARRVQADLRRATGRYFPLAQVVASIHAIKDGGDRDHTTRSGSAGGSPPARVPLQITITPTSPPSTAVDTPSSSMSRRRLACNIPALQTRLIIPASSMSFLSPTYGSPSTLSPSSFRPLLTFSRRSSLSSGESTGCPVTPIDQITHTPLSPPRIPRAPPPPPRTWARLRAQMHNNETSPLVSPSLPFTPYVLSPICAGKPALHPLRIPVTDTLAAGDAELRDNHLSPSLRSFSPFGPVPSPLGEGPSASATIQRRPVPSRNNSTSSLTREALLRASRPHIVRRFSVSDPNYQDQHFDRYISPVSPVAFARSPSGIALASPFLIQSEEMDKGYFRF
ncbi:hypothetical protein TRAPUB_12883 [Trametes pubescens]|uniref:Uncharacterized protein n=1 Tax=Trametes pubescens TaxID=154538 RepID=A0A1M2VSK4_TRAPU|nr:hypothetical protein TRAPUB_12883 [Trametes pubescens]